jgi:hypothetical protein
VQVEDRGPGNEKGIVDSRPPAQEQQADRGMALNQNTIQSNLDDIVTLGLPPGREQQADRGMTLNLETIPSDLNDIVTQELQLGQELQVDRGMALNPDMFHSDFDDIVTLGPPGQQLQADRGMTLNLETIDSNPGDILELNLHRGKSLSLNWQAKVAPGIIVPDTDETPATADSHPWKLVDDRAKDVALNQS